HPIPPPTPRAHENRGKRRRRNLPWVDWGIVVILVVVLGAVALVLSRNIKRHRTMEVPTTAVVETMPPEPTNPVTYEAAEAEPSVIEEEELESAAPKPAPAPAPAEKPKAEAPKPVNRKPTEITLKVQNRNNT